MCGDELEGVKRTPPPWGFQREDLPARASRGWGTAGWVSWVHTAQPHRDSTGGTMRTPSNYAENVFENLLCCIQRSTRWERGEELDQKILMEQQAHISNFQVLEHSTDFFT